MNSQVESSVDASLTNVEEEHAARDRGYRAVRRPSPLLRLRSRALAGCPFPRTARRSSPDRRAHAYDEGRVRRWPSSWKSSTASCAQLRGAAAVRRDRGRAKNRHRRRLRRAVCGRRCQVGQATRARVIGTERPYAIGLDGGVSRSWFQSSCLSPARQHSHGMKRAEGRRTRARGRVSYA